MTITGAGGCGKTRLAVEALGRLGARWPDGARWVGLEAVTDPARVPEVAAVAVGALVDPAGNPRRDLAAHLRDRQVAVCLDNCEHLLDACAELVDALLRACPDVTVLATSREPLGVAGETVWRVPSMAEREAMELFADRAQWVRPRFAVDAGNEDAVRTVCRRLDGIPLAVELAAAWVRMLTPGQIAAALDDRFRLLVGGPHGAIPRHQTLAASVDWSYGLLRDEARTLLRRLAVFSGGFGLDAAEAVCAGDGLAADEVLGALGRLVDTSLVAVTEDERGARYRLPETIRQYAADRLDEAGESVATRDRHLTHFLATAEAGAADLDRSGHADGAALADQDVVLAGLERDHDNLRAALAWGLSRPDPEPGRRLAAALWRLWLVHGHASEGIQALQRALDAAPDDRSGLQAELLAGLALLGMPAGRLDLCDEAARRAVEIATACGDDRSLARAYAACCYLPFYVDYARCEEVARLCQRHGEAAGDAFAVDWGQLLEACSYMTRDRNDEAVAVVRALLDRSLPRNERFCTAFALSVEMHAAALTGDVRHAVAMGSAAMRRAQPLKDHFTVGTNTVNMAWVLGLAGDVAEGRRLMDTVVRTLEDAGPDVDAVSMSLIAGRLWLWSGDLEGAVEWLTGATRFGAPRTPNWVSVRAFPVLSGALRRLGRFDEARQQAERGIEAARTLGTHHAEAEALDELALAVGADDPGQAEDLHHQALRIRLDHGLRTPLADSLDALARLAAGAGGHAEAARLLAASDAARDDMGYPRLAIDGPDHEALVDALRAELGDDGFAAAWDEGAQLALDDAVAYVTRARGTRQRPTIGWGSLTPTEHQVVTLVLEGLTNPDIAARLFVSRNTVKTHLSHIYAKLGVANRTELASLASARRDRSPTPSPADHPSA